jgi:CheY-like chemotaxis protein
VYGIIKNHGGHINVYSEKDRGTTFTIYLPASEKEVHEEQEPTVSILKGTGTILLIDDEEMIIDTGEELLKELGYRVLVAKSGLEAIEVYNNNHKTIDLVIMDMIMPGMGGGEAYDRLKKINPEVKVLLSSGYSINGQATRILNRGCDGFIQKPFNMKQLSEKIHSIIGKQ